MFSNNSRDDRHPLDPQALCIISASVGKTFEQAFPAAESTADSSIIAQSRCRLPAGVSVHESPEITSLVSAPYEYSWTEWLVKATKPLHSFLRSGVSPMFELSDPSNVVDVFVVVFAGTCHNSAEYCPLRGN